MKRVFVACGVAGLLLLQAAPPLVGASPELDELAGRPDAVGNYYLRARFERYHAPGGSDPVDRSKWSDPQHGPQAFDLDISVMHPDFRVHARNGNETMSRRNVIYAWLQCEMFTHATQPDGRISYSISKEPRSGLLIPYPILTPCELQMFHVNYGLSDMAARGWLSVESRSGDEVKVIGKVPELPSSTIRATLSRSAGMLPIFIEVRTEAKGLKPMWGQMRVVQTVGVGSGTIVGEAITVTRNPNLSPDYMVFHHRVIEAEAVRELTLDDLRPPMPTRYAAVYDTIRGYYREYDTAGEVIRNKEISQDDVARQQAAVRRNVAAGIAKDETLASRRRALHWGASAALILTAAMFAAWLRVRARRRAAGLA